MTGGPPGRTSRVKLHLLGYLVQWVIESRRTENEIYAAVVGTLPGSLTGVEVQRKRGIHSSRASASCNAEAREDGLFQITSVPPC